MLSGEVVAEVAGQLLHARRGRQHQDHRELPHRFMNESDRDAEVMIIISPPTF